MYCTGGTEYTPVGSPAAHSTCAIKNSVSQGLVVCPVVKYRQLQSRVQTPPSHEEEGLVTIDCFLGYAESAILIFEQVNDYLFMT